MATYTANDDRYEAGRAPPAKRAGRHTSRLLVFVVAAGGLLLSSLVYALLHEREYRAVETRFQLAAQQRVEAVQQALSDRLGVVTVLVAYYAGSEEVTRREFHTFTRRSMQTGAYPDLQYLAWASLVSAEAREAHERKAGAEGMPQYRIGERNAAGKLAPAGARDEYFPVCFIEPHARYNALMGFDLGSNPHLLSALRQAMRPESYGEPLAVAAAPLDAAGEEACELYVLASVKNVGAESDAQPPEERKFDSFVLGNFRIAEMVARAIGRLEPAEIDAYLCAGSASGQPTLLCVQPAPFRDAGQEPPPALPADDAEVLRHEVSFSLGGQQWTVCCATSESYIQRQRSWWPAGALLSGILLSGLLAGYLFLLTERTARVEREVAARTAELHTISNAALDAVVMTDPQGNVVHWNPAAERIFGYGREEILGRGVHGTLVPPEYAARAARGLREFAATGRGAVVGRVLEMEALHKDGSRFPIEISVSAIELSGRWWAVAIVRDITRRKRAEEALQKEQRLLKQMLDLQERERKLVAYEIHDGLAQQLTGALYKFQAVERLRSSDPQEAEAVFAEGLRMLADAMAETRRLIGGLRPLVLDESGIVAAIDYLIAEHKQRHGPEIEFSHKIRFQRLAPPLESAVFRIVQESLTNACRYSRSAKVRVEVTQLDDRVRVEVQDWGVGFDPQRIDGGHFGLQGIRERARLFGGTAAIDTAPGQGTRVSVELPLVETAAEAAETPQQRP